MTKLFARIESGRVAELASLPANPSDLFHPEIHWVDASGVTGIALGWLFDGQHFLKPDDQPTASDQVSVSSLQARLSELAAQLAKLSG
jgi:hypothetical protein